MSETEPRSNSMPVASIIAGAVVAMAGPFIWFGCYKIGALWLAAIGIGVLIGIAMRVTNKTGDRRMQPIAAVLSAISCFIGYIIVDMTLIKWFDSAGNPIPPSVGNALQHLLQDFQSILFVAIGAYLAYILARRNPSATAPE